MWACQCIPSGEQGLVSSLLHSNITTKASAVWNNRKGTFPSIPKRTSAAVCDIWVLISHFILEEPRILPSITTYKPRKEASEDYNPAGTLISDFQLPELGGNAFLLFRPHSLWYFLMAALENEYSLLGLEQGLQEIQRLSKTCSCYSHGLIILEWDNFRMTLNLKNKTAKVVFLWVLFHLKNHLLCL